MTHPSRQDLNKSHDSFDHQFVTPLPIAHPNVEKAIELLEDINIDGETMEYIITRLFMREQMLKQLMHTCQWFDVRTHFDEVQTIVNIDNIIKDREMDERMNRRKIYTQ